MINNIVLKEQIKNLMANAYYIPAELALFPWNIKAPFSELNWHSYGSGKELFNTIKHCLVPVKDRRANIRHGYALPNSGQAIEDNQAWFFINGLGSSRELLQLNGEALAELFGRKVNLLFNASEGLLSDVAECLLGQLGENSSQVASSLCKLLEPELRQRDKIVLLAHSQGGMISLRMAVKLMERLAKQSNSESLLSKLEIYTFGCAASELGLSDRIHVEHFANSGDLIARIGVLKKANSPSAKVFVNGEGRGHLLNSHYLPFFKTGKFHNKQGLGSRLSTYLKRA